MENLSIRSKISYRRNRENAAGSGSRLSHDLDSKPENPTLDPKTRELIALAVAVTTRCDGCISVHIEAAKKHGATREEILEALSVAVGINTGTALIFSARAMDAFDNI